MGIRGTSTGRLGRHLLVAVFCAAAPTFAGAQFFDGLRPPGEVPSAPGSPRGQGPQAPPQIAPAATPPQAAPSAGQGTLALSARFGRDLPAINGGLYWRIYRTDQNGVPRLVKEDKTAAPTFALPAGAYVVHVGFGLASVTKAVQLRAETLRDVLEIPAGGLRIEGRVGDVRIPPGQISFDLYKGSQFEPGDKRPIATGIATGDLVLVPEGTYHIVSNYGDANATVRSDIRVQVGKLTDTTISHRAAIVTLKLVNERGGEARANTQWSVLTPGGDVIKESIGAFPRVILAEGEYRAIARNDNRTYERDFRVVNGVDGEIEVIAR